MDKLLIFFLGASLGSFIGLVVDRFPEASIIKPRSHCNHCQQILASRDLIPIVSQIFNRFSCRFCGVRTPLTYCLLEASCGLSLLLGWLGILNWTQVFLLLLSLTLSLYDLKSHEYPLIIVILAGLVLLPFYPINSPSLCLFLLGLLAQLFSFGIGAGDFYYLALLALTLDFRSTIWLLQMGSLLAIFFFLKTKRRKKALAFLPFLSLAYMLELILMMT
ncbi:prepilin peptidase [Streptococcus dentapri]|uniref:Prepilin peptidase n=1 Tax=Streptococcus dentapri TaxID=573564 RepID=A0ABV8D2X8_9STRE